MIEKVRIRGYRTHKDFIFRPNPKLNLIAGPNESGKSTLIEAIALALTGRVNGRSASEELNPYWFNIDNVNSFVASRRRGENVAWPEIHIEVFLQNKSELQALCGAINSDNPVNSCPGVAFSVIPNPDYADEFQAISQDCLSPLPVEFFKTEWRTFADSPLTSRPRQLSTAIIDSRTVRSATGVDYHMRYILSDGLDPSDRAAISVAYRQVKAGMTNTTLRPVNERMAGLNATLHDQDITLAMDQSSRTSWEGAVTPHVNEIPFGLSGQGQQAAIKISLAMSRSSQKAGIVMIEEPENHMTHSSLVKVISRIESLASDDQQLFIATHSSFVVNRLGVDRIHLLGSEVAKKLSDLRPETVAYFQKLPGYDTLRMALAQKVVLVEGPSDEILFERVYKDLYSVRPIENGIDVLSMRGLSFARCLELCAELGQMVAALRDNDGKEPADLRSPLQDWLEDGIREIFIGDNAKGNTLEPQLINHNSEDILRRVLALTSQADILTWMTREKTEAALRIAKSTECITPPSYMNNAAVFIHG
jgi:predicted ATPase